MVLSPDVSSFFWYSFRDWGQRGKTGRSDGHLTSSTLKQQESKSKQLQKTPTDAQWVESSLLRARFGVSYQHVAHLFDLFIDMVEDLFAALCTLLDSLLLCGVLCQRQTTQS